eukprot:121434-Pyramimonas_sp.AAC.1
MRSRISTSQSSQKTINIPAPGATSRHQKDTSTDQTYRKHDSGPPCRGPHSSAIRPTTRPNRTSCETHPIMSDVTHATNDWGNPACARTLSPNYKLRAS